MERMDTTTRTRRGAILEAASSLLATHGYAGTTMQMIADAAGFSVGYLYKHFPGKEALVDEIYVSRMEAFEATRHEMRRLYADRPLKGVQELYRRLSRQIRENVHLLRMVFESEVESPISKPEFAVRHRRGITEMIRDAVAAGEIRPVDPELLAAALDGAFWGLLRYLSDSGRVERIAEAPDQIDALFLEPLKTDHGKDYPS